MGGIYCGHAMCVSQQVDLVARRAQEALHKHFFSVLFFFLLARNDALFPYKVALYMCNYGAAKCLFSISVALPPPRRFDNSCRRLID